MKKNKLFDKQSLLLLVSVVAINVLCLITVSYAYFTAQIKGNDTAKPITVIMGTMKIEYKDSDAVSLNNAYPGDDITNKFNIINTGTLDATYNIRVDITENTFVDKKDLVYTLKRDGTELVTDQAFPESGSNYIRVGETLAPGATKENPTTAKYELIVKFKEDTVNRNQNDNKGKKLNFKIQVDSKEDATLGPVSAIANNLSSEESVEAPTEVGS